VAKVTYSDQIQPDFGLPWRPVLTREQVKDWDTERLAKYITLRKQVEKGAVDNPVGQGWSLPMWDKVMANWSKYRTHCILGGNRSSKSIFAARMAVWAAATIPESQVRMYHVNSERSIQDQQQMVWDALPVSIKNLPTKKGANHSLQFSQKNGFTDSICILPPLPGYRKGGSIIFGNYRQFQQDEQVAEGFKAHAIFCDEECPQKFFETLLFRTIDYDGKIFLTFTTLQGWTPLIQDILGKIHAIIHDADYSQNVLMGEDFYFCKLARDSGFELFIDNNLLVPHKSEVLLPVKNQDLLKELLQEWRLSNNANPEEVKALTSKLRPHLNNDIP